MFFICSFTSANNKKMILKNTIEEDDYCDYENILSKFDGKLGFEAKAIIKTLLALKEQ